MPLFNTLFDSPLGTVGYAKVNTYADLPDATLNPGQLYIVLTGTGIYPLNRKSAGLYYSNGVSWARLGNIPAYFDDGNFGVYNNADNTKEVKLDTSGITTSTIRTLAVPDADGTIALTTGLTPNHSDLNLDDGTNPHGTTKSDVGLGNVDNTSDADKPVSTAQQAAFDLKADKTNVLELDNTTPFTPDQDYEPATKLSSETAANVAGEAFANGKDAFRVANGGVNGGNLGLTTQICLTCEQDISQITSLEDGNVVEVYNNGTDFAAGTVAVRRFMRKNELYVHTPSPAGTIVQSGKGVYCVSGEGDAGSGNISPMPFGLEGYAGRQFFLFAQRNSQHGQNRTAKNIINITNSGGFAQVEFDAAHGYNINANQNCYITGTTNYNGDSQFAYVNTTTILTELAYIADETSGAFYGADVGIVYVASGAVASDVQLLSGDGLTVIDSASLGPFGLANLYTNANGEFQVVATQPVFCGFAARQAGASTGDGSQQFAYDCKLLTPMNASATEVLVQNRNSRVSALYDNTEVYWYRQNGELGKFTVSPGSFRAIYTGIFNELGDVFKIDSNSTPATAGTFDIQVASNNIHDQASAGTFSNNQDMDEDNSVTFVTFTTPASAPTGVPGEVVYTLGSTPGVSVILNENYELELFWGTAQTSPRLLTAALSPSTQYSLVVEYRAGDSVNVHYATGASFTFYTMNRPPESSLSDTRVDYTNENGGGYGQVNSSGNIGGYNGTISGTTTFQGTLDGSFIHSYYGMTLPYGAAATITASSIAYNAGVDDLYSAFEAAGISKLAVKIEGALKINLGEASARVYIYLLDAFKRVLSSPAIVTTGLTGNPHTLASYQTGTTADNAGNDTDFAKEGCLVLKASGPISAFAGADGSGLEAAYATPTSAAGQRIALPLATTQAGPGDTSGIAVHSKYKGDAKIYDRDGALLYAFTFDRAASLANPEDEFEQRFPCAYHITGTTGTGGDEVFTADFLSGTIETTVPVAVVMNTDESDQYITIANGFNAQGFETNADEITLVGITPENIRAVLKRDGDTGMIYNERILSGVTTWEKV